MTVWRSLTVQLFSATVTNATKCFTPVWLCNVFFFSLSGPTCAWAIHLYFSRPVLSSRPNLFSHQAIASSSQLASIPVSECSLLQEHLLTYSTIFKHSSYSLSQVFIWSNGNVLSIYFYCYRNTTVQTSLATKPSKIAFRCPCHCFVGVILFLAQWPCSYVLLIR